MNWTGWIRCNPTTLMNEASNSKLNFRLMGLLIFSIALLLRLIHLWMITDSPYFSSPILDARLFDRQAWDIAQGSRPFDEAFFQAPFYPYFLAAIYKIFGHNYLVPRLIQAVLGASSAWLVYRLGSRVYDRRIGFISGLIVAFYGPLIHYTGQLLITTLFVFLVCWFLLAFDRLIEKPSRGNFFLSGILLGTAALARPNILIFVPFALAWIFLGLKNRGSGIPIFIAGIALVILPVTVRNYLVEKDFVLISSQAGVNFYMGNNAWATGRSAWVPGTSRNWWEEGYLQQREIAEKNAGHPLKSSQVSAYWWKRTRSDIAQNPKGWTNLLLNKIRYLFAGYELSDTEDIYYQRRFSPLFAFLMWDGIVDFPFGILLPLGFLGLALSANRKRQGHLILFQLSYAAGLLLFIITSRYRLPLVPVSAIWAAAGLVLPFQSIHRGRFSRWILTFLGFIILLISVNRNPAKNQLVPLLDGAVNLGNKYLDLKDNQRALDAFKEAARLDTASVRAAYGMGVALLNLGKIDEAKEQFERAIRLDPATIKARNNLGRILQQRGDFEGALRQFNAVLKLDSSDVYAHRGCADIALEKQDYAAAVQHYENAYHLGASDRQLISRWAQALLLQGKYEDALKVNSILLQREPNNARIHHNQARIYAFCDSLQRAAEELETVLRLAPQNEEARRELEEIRRVLKTKP
jgi:tetratricopeptide (TPR) repeat protein